MSREAHIPLALWISAALVCHALGGGGTLEVAQTALDKQDLRDLIKLERQTLKPEDKVFEVLTADQFPTPTNKEVAAPDKDSDATDDAVDDDKDKKPEPAKPEVVKPPKEEEAKKPPPPEVAQKPPEPEKKKQPVLVPAVPAPPAPPPPPPPPPDKRLAVMQHSEKNQPDNPNANRIADDANHVAEETMAKIRSHDQDMENPSAGPSKALGPAEEKGNSDKDKEAESENRIGDDDHAPGEKSKHASDAQHATPAVQAPMQLTPGPPPSVPNTRGTGDKVATGPRTASPPPSPGGQGPASPEVQNGGNGQGSWSLDPNNPGGDGASRVAGRKRAGKPFESPVHVGAFGLGGNGLPGGPNLNLTMPGLTQAVGDEQLRKERENDGASRRGEHAGRMKNATDFQKYRAAIENYDPSVKPGDKTSLNAARSAFASYLVTMHNKIHPLFGDRELESLDGSKDKQFSDQNMYAVAEIVIAPDTGRVIRRGIVKNSGSTAFDTIVLKMIDSSQPYGKTPDAIISYDGKVYLHWEVQRNHVDACSNRNAFPIMKKQPAGVQKVTPTPPGAPPRPAGKNPDEQVGAPSAPLRPLRE